MKASKPYFEHGGFFIAMKTDNRRTHPLWPTYAGICGRCNQPSNRKFKDYGGRGIKICERWLGVGGFSNFCIDMGPKPSKEYSIDRIDNNGNYEPGNCRWATLHQQAANRRVAAEDRGVYWYGKKKVWVAALRFNGVTYRLGRFKDKSRAIAARKAAEERFGITYEVILPRGAGGKPLCKGDACARCVCELPWVEMFTDIRNIHKKARSRTKQAL